MVNRMIRIGMASFMVTALSAGAAFAQDEDPLMEGDASAEGEYGVDGAEGEYGAEGEATTEGDGSAGGEAAATTTEVAAEGGGHGLTLPAGSIAINVPLQIGLSTDRAFKPISIAPDVWYGVNDQLTVGLVHSIMGKTGFWSGAQLGLGGSGICLSGEENGCAKVYDNVGAEVIYDFGMTGPMQIAANGGLHVHGFDPFRLGLKAGIKGAYTTGKIGVMFDPHIFIGLTERDAGNEEVLDIPVAFTYMASPQLGVGVQTGIQAPLDGFGDGYRVPLALGAMYMINHQMHIGGSFTLERLLGFEGPDAFDLRSLNVFFGYAM